jgi:hypothetical protein
MCKARPMSRIGVALAFVLAAAAAAGTSFASAPPVGALPAGPTASIATKTGELVAFALPHRGGGRAWRVARAVDGRVLRQVSEADVGDQVVLVFKASGRGKVVVVFALTRGERPKAYESRRFAVTVS